MIRNGWRNFSRGLWVLLILTACHKGSTLSSAPEKTFIVNGVVRALEPDGKTVVIQHEAIPNYMAAMTMPFEVRDANQLRGLKPGDAITFRMFVNSNEGWIGGISVRQKSPEPDLTNAPTPSAVHISHAVAELDEGDRLPDCHFTNELGQAVSLSQFKGRVIAFTFFFTSCPYPNFCPRLTSNFAKVDADLRQRPDAPAHWHLFSISFDPKNDRPQRLLNYAQNAHYDPSHWSFLTGDPEQIGALADQFGENFWAENGSLSHNFRTVVIDASGKVRKIFQGNNWTSGDLENAMIKALKSP